MSFDLSTFVVVVAGVIAAGYVTKKTGLGG